MKPFAVPWSSLNTTFRLIINQAVPINCKHKVFVRTNYISDSLEIRKAQDLIRFAELRSSLDTASALIIIKGAADVCYVLPQRSQT